MTSQACFTNELYDIEDRLLVIDDSWYARTREIAELGPFGTREEAIAGLYQHIDLWNSPGKPGLLESFPASTVHRTNECDVPECGLCQELALLKDCTILRPSFR